MAEEPVSLEQAKAHLRLSPSVTAQDAHLYGLITAARRAVENDIDMSNVGDAPELQEADLPVVREAILLLIGHWYWNREAVSDASLKALPLAVG